MSCHHFQKEGFSNEGAALTRLNQGCNDAISADHIHVKREVNPVYLWASDPAEVYQSQ